MSIKTKTSCALIAFVLAGECFAYYGRPDDKAPVSPEQNQAQKRLLDLQRAINHDVFGVCLSNLSSRDRASVEWLLDTTEEITPRVMHTLVLLDNKIADLSACSFPQASK